MDPASTKKIDEDEAALYDRQIRLWGVEAQNRMKTASVLLVNLRGLASEVAKNIVLAGIGRLVLLDDKVVTEQDLGSGYFYRDQDLTQNRAKAAQPRIQDLNPRVQVSAETELDILKDEAALKTFDLVCITDSDTNTLMQLNATCRKCNVKLYAAASLGLSGYIFADLLEHEYTVQKLDPQVKPEPGVEVPKIAVLKKQSFVPLESALQHSWKGAKPALRAKNLPKMQSVFETLAWLKYQQEHQGVAPIEADQLLSTAKAILPEKGIDVTSLQPSRFEFLVATADADFSPTCAVIGGVLGQDILNALGGRESPIVNFFTWDGELNAGDIYALNVKRTA